MSAIFYELSIGDYVDGARTASYTLFDGCDWQHSHDIKFYADRSMNITANEIIIDRMVDNCMTVASFGMNREQRIIWRDAIPTSRASISYMTRVRDTDLICYNEPKSFGRALGHIEFLNTTTELSHIVDIPPQLLVAYAQPIGTGRMYIADNHDIMIDPLISSYKCTNMVTDTTKTFKSVWSGAIGENTIYMHWSTVGDLEMRDIRMADPQFMGKLRESEGFSTFLQSGHIVCKNPDATHTQLFDLRMPGDAYDLPPNDRINYSLYVRYIDA